MDLDAWLLIGIFISFSLGHVIGCFIGSAHKKEESIGTIKVDNSDPVDGPILFIELEKDGLQKLYAKEYVMMKVDLNSYLPRK